MHNAILSRSCGKSHYQERATVERETRSGRTFRVVNTTYGILQWQAHANHVAISSFVDLALAVYPIVLFWDLRIQMLKKLVLSVLFAFGIVYVDHSTHTKQTAEMQTGPVYVASFGP